MSLPERSADQSLLDLAGSRQGKRRAKLNAAWALVSGDEALAMRDQLLGADLDIRLRHNDGVNAFAPLL